MHSKQEYKVYCFLLLVVVSSAKSLSSAPWTFPESPKADQKRSLFSPFSPFNPFSPLNSYAFGPYAGPYNPFTPTYYQGPPSSYGAGSYTSDTSSRRRRYMEDPASVNSGRPPLYPGLSPISEEPEESKPIRSAIDPALSNKTPIEYLPPFGMYGPMIDPSMFISKKTMFLDNLFKTLATSTPPPATTDDVPATKATIVPPDFWLPNSITPGPMEYNNKVVDFLDKLFDNLKMNRTAPSDDVIKYNFVRSMDFDSTTQKKVARSLDDIAAISAAKDSIVDSILSELSDLKGDMVTTLDDLVTFQKTFPSSSSKKSFKAGPWSKFDTADPSLPFKQRMAMIGQVFDMLTALQRNITSAVQEAVNAKLENTKSFNDIGTPGANINMTLFDAIKSKLSSLDPYKQAYNGAYSPKFSRTVPQTATSFWVAYPQDNSLGAVKRQVEEDPSGRMYNEMSMEDKKNQIKQKTRAVEMEMHQGYQSMPPGTLESVQAGGGSALGHEGGGINLLIQMPMSRSQTPAYENESDNYWQKYSKNQGHRRQHHNHH